MSKHQCEKWQLLESAKGGTYCGACGDHKEANSDDVENAK
jgi:hypothetical protein